MRVLAPGQVHEVRLDLAWARWPLRSPGGESRSAGQLTWGDWFRLLYGPPRAEDCARLRESSTCDLQR